MKTLITAALVSALFATAAGAAPETYAIDPTHTAPRFEYSHFGFSNQVHRFDKTSGTIVIDRAAKTGSVEVSIDTTSVNTGYAKFNEHIQAEDFFNTAKYPTITFKSTKVNFEGEVPVSVEGQLTIKDVTKPVTLTVTSFHSMMHPIVKKPAIGANASTMIKRTEFNAGKYAPNVSDDVKLSISVEAVQQ